MRFSATLALLGALLLRLAAAGPNPISSPTSGSIVKAGQTFPIKWSPTTGGTVTLILRSGAANDLLQGMIIASSIPNSGSYSWAVESSITRGTSYTIEIVDDAATTDYNFSPFFEIDSKVSVASSTSIVKLGAPTAAAAPAPAHATVISQPVYPGAVTGSKGPTTMSMMPSASGTVPPQVTVTEVSMSAAAAATTTAGAAAELVRDKALYAIAAAAGLGAVVAL